MDFEYNDDQHLLMTSFEALLERHREIPHGQHGYVNYSAELQAELEASGYLDLLAQDGFGPLEGALMVEAAARCPASVELAASLLLRPMLGDVPAPVAVAWGLGKPVRYLSQARTLCIIDGDRVMAGSVSPGIIRPLHGTPAYPLAVLERLPADVREMTGAMAEAIRRRALIGMAAEAAGLMCGALDNTVQYVKDRQQFGQPLGHFQGVQHRLAESAQLVRTARWLALRAAHADDAQAATMACLYAQDTMRKVINDCHQFSGAMGLTLEFPLHLWTYRLKVLQGEGGGRGGHGLALARQVWPAREPADNRNSRMEIAR